MLRTLTPRQLAFDVVFSVLCVLLRIAVLDSLPWVGELLFVLCMGAALAVRRLMPPVALGIAWVGAVIQMSSALPPDVANLSILAVLYASAAYGSTRVKWLGLLSAGAGAVVGAVYLVFPVMVNNGSPTAIPVGEIPFTFFAILFTTGAMAVLLGLSWTLGLLARTRAAARASREALVRAEEEERQARRLTIVEQERNRIARDMHDVVAHSLAVVIAQADGARYALAADPAAASEALSTISTTAREALGDVRVLLEQLRHSQGEGPQPTLADLERLIAQVRSSGLEIVETVTGDPRPLGTAQQLAVYRIVQEALTNVLRHGDTARPTVLSFEWAGDAVRILVDSAANGDRPDEESRLGHGIAGMRERALLVGGSLVAEPHGERFRVDARIPAPELSPLTHEQGATHG